MSEVEFTAFVAIDWADQKHYWHLADAAGLGRQHGELVHKPEPIHDWVAGLFTRFPEGLIAVCLEQSRGALVYQLANYARLVLYPVHPATLNSFRQAFYPSGSKGDPSDAGLLLELLLHHRQRLRRLNPDTAETRLLRMLCELRRRLVDERTRQSNRLTAWLKLYFPQPLDWIDNIDSPLGCDLLERWPTLALLQQADTETIERFFREHHSRSQARIQQRLTAIRAAIPAVHDTALVQAGIASVTSLVSLLKTLNSAIANVDQQIAEQTAKHPEAALFTNLPGAGAVLVPRLIAAFGTQRDRYESAAELAAYSGIAPVTRQSGQSKSVHFRFVCPKFLRQTFHELAAHSAVRSQWAREYYQQQRKKGKRHHAAVRSLAFKWIRILFRCWMDGVPYHEAQHVRALQLRRKLPESDSDAGD